MTRTTTCCFAALSLSAIILLAGCGQPTGVMLSTLVETPAATPIPLATTRATNDTLTPAATATQALPQAGAKFVQLDVYVGLRVSSLEEAIERVKFDVRMPTVLPAGYKLDAISIGEPVDQWVRIVFTNGDHHIIVGQRVVDTSNAHQFTDEELVELRQEKVTIGTYPGMGHGANVVKTMRGYLQEYGSIVWYPVGLARSIWTVDDASVTLEDLIKMAESMELAP
jgi:hypothetical protein